MDRRPARWFVKLQQHVNGDVDICIRHGGYGGVGKVDSFPSPGPGEILWFGCIELSSPGNAKMGMTLATMWSTEHGPLRRPIRTNVRWRVLVHGVAMSEWHVMEESRRVARGPNNTPARLQAAI